ncbi:MAG: UDP-N-acetylmuramate--L-alanine ligase [Bacteroidota bacterium]
MHINEIHRVYFLGIGGIGMSALARYFLWMGKEVYGYDRTGSDITRQLESEGAMINYEDVSEVIPGDIDLVIYTPAIPRFSAQRMYFEALGIPMYKRAEVLGMVASGLPVIAVAGTHGKTSISTILAHIFKTAESRFMAFLGGISTNHYTNFLVSDNPQLVIAEADEYDRSFLQLFPDIALITSMDADHLDVYGSLETLHESFRLFVANIRGNGTLITHRRLTQLNDLNVENLTYSLEDKADFSAANIRIENGQYRCEFIHKDKAYPVVFGGAGRHNLENALAASAVAAKAGIVWKDIVSALATYKGVKRRFEIMLHEPLMVYIDDYAHHPEEIKTCVASAREMFPSKKITGVFQPHLYSRTRDFAAEFGQALDLLDEVIVLDIYPAREQPIEGVDAKLILDHIHTARKHHLSDENLIPFVEKGNFEVFITMGAGSIDRFVAAIKDALIKKIVK